MRPTVALVATPDADQQSFHSHHVVVAHLYSSHVVAAHLFSSHADVAHRRHVHRHVEHALEHVGLASDVADAEHDRTHDATPVAEHDRTHVVTPVVTLDAAPDVDPLFLPDAALVVVQLLAARSWELQLLLQKQSLTSQFLQHQHQSQTDSKSE